MKRILLFDTAIATSNLGDEIIFSCAKQGLMPVINNASIYRMGTHIVNYSALQMVLHRYIYPDKKIKWINEDIDYKFICGTNLLMNNLVSPRPQFMLNPMNKYLYYDSILVGVGRLKDFNRFSNHYTAGLYRDILSKKYIHSVRDDATKKLLDTIGIRSVNTGCPTLWMMTKEKCKKIPQKKAENVVFSVSGYVEMRDFEKDRFMVNCLENSYNKLYAWIQTATDEEYLRNLIDIEKNKIETIYSLNQYERILNEGNIDYVGTRLHGGIFALQHDVRSLIVAIDERARGFHERTNLPIIGREDLSQLKDKIYGNIITDIKIQEQEIRQFLDQFL